MGIIQASEVCKSFGEKEVLKGVSFDIAPGEIYGLLGPSGSGKTTLIKILTGQLKADGGKTELLGIESGRIGNENRAKIGIMMDEFGIYERLSVYNNLCVMADLFGIDKSKIDETLKEVGLYEARKTPAGKLSKGMKSRLRLSRPLLQNPEIMFLDEPTSGLDPATADEIHEVLLKKRKAGCTIFLTTHNMNEAEKMCDRIALLSHGRIIEEGIPAEICRKYDTLKKLNIVLADGSAKSLPANASSADELARLLREGKICTVHSSEPNLETVFTELTGNKLGV